MTINTVGVIGAGTMGNGIAQVCAAAGFQVTLIDLSERALAKGLETIAANLQRLISKERLTTVEKDRIHARIQSSTDYQNLLGADLVIEAATESLELKRQILQQIDALVPGSTLIATNTSSISITDLAATIRAPERFIGLHFFNPVPVMTLVEVIRGLQTADATRAAALEFAGRIGKTAIDVRNAPGFVVNRLLIPMINEAVFVLQEGLASAADIDLGMRLGCNHPIGPLALADLIGLDTTLAIMEVLYKGFADPKYRPAPLLREMVAAGRFGRKSGQGFFAY